MEAHPRGESSQDAGSMSQLFFHGRTVFRDGLRPVVERLQGRLAIIPADPEGEAIWLQ